MLLGLYLALSVRFSSVSLTTRRSLGIFVDTYLLRDLDVIDFMYASVAFTAYHAVCDELGQIVYCIPCRV